MNDKAKNPYGCPENNSEEQEVVAQAIEDYTKRLINGPQARYLASSILMAVRWNHFNWKRTTEEPSE